MGARAAGIPYQQRIDIGDPGGWMGVLGGSQANETAISASLCQRPPSDVHTTVSSSVLVLAAGVLACSSHVMLLVVRWF